MARARGRVRWDDDEITRRIIQAPARADVALTAVIERGAPRAEAHMRSNAPWTDRTSNARTGLHAITHRDRLRLYAIVLAHTVAYGIWLETNYGGRYRIIEPSLRDQGHEVMQDASHLFEVMFG